MKFFLNKIEDKIFGYVSKYFFNSFYPAVKSDDKNSIVNQRKILEWLLKEIKLTKFGKEFNLGNVCNSEDIYSEFCKNVPIFEYKD